MISYKDNSIFKSDKIIRFKNLMYLVLREKLRFQLWCTVLMLIQLHMYGSKIGEATTLSIALNITEKMAKSSVLENSTILFE